MSTIYIKNSQGKPIGRINVIDYKDGVIKKVACRDSDSMPIATYNSQWGFTTNELTGERRDGDATHILLIEYDIHESYKKKAQQLSEQSSDGPSTDVAVGMDVGGGYGAIGRLFGTPLAIVIVIIIGIYVAKHDIKPSNEHATASQTAETTISTDAKKTLIADTPDTVHETNLDQDAKDTQASSVVAETNDSLNQEKTYETSFNCTKASNFVEKSICTDSSLAQLDIALSDTYKEKLSQADNKAEFKQNQKEWVLNTEDACQDKECIENAINQRISYLKN